VLDGGLTRERMGHESPKGGQRIKGHRTYGVVLFDGQFEVYDAGACGCHFELEIVSRGGERGSSK